MTYFIILVSITILLAFLIKIGIFYLLINFLNRLVKFSTALKVILLYEVGSFLFWVLDLLSLRYFFPAQLWLFSYVLHLLVSTIILFLFLYFLMGKFSLLNFKKTLIIFLIMFFMVTPFISYSRGTLTYSMTKSFFPDVASELPILNEMIETFPAFQGLTPSAKTIKIINIIDDSLLGGKFFKELRRLIFTL